ncbi:SAM-dependent methyltransferase [Crossiella equi]|uniref:SAM-dependent methyltransferase n=1 Tax=Crossiella equi TaxID=130796 RepID=A0ABS5A4H1_9PSEU|nr:class I SAM-dependent methyltransferase [Crossiella equi]MBP2471177.1 SAM-dependent methyltransferase [Crossiella equi]
MTMTPVEAWERFAQRSTPRREVNAAGARTWLNWTQYPDHGPDESILGDVAGKKVLDLGCGSGDNLAHLATLGAHCTGVDLAPSRIADATATWSHARRIDFRTADAVDYLDTTVSRFDIAISIFGAVWFSNPAKLLPLIHRVLTPGGRLAFSHLPTIALHDPEQVVPKWELPVAEWREHLRIAGFQLTRAKRVTAPRDGEVGTLLVVADA